MADERRYYDPKTKTFLPGARCNIEQYRMLLRSSDKRHVTDWNEWSDTHPPHTCPPYPSFSSSLLRGLRDGPSPVRLCGESPVFSSSSE